jgi:hypothetical protein
MSQRVAIIAISPACVRGVSDLVVEMLSLKSALFHKVC